MRILVTGATGLLGTRVVERSKGDDVVATSRHERPSQDGVSWIAADLAAPGPWQASAAAAEAVVHLAGEPLAARRWSAAQKERLVRSRVESTRLLVEALGGQTRTLVCASAVGIYGARGDEPLDESAPPGTGFLANLCRRWEDAALAAAARGVRVVCLRFGVVLSGRGGALARMLPAFKLMVGGSLGDPEAWFPWIHEDDAVGLVFQALDPVGRLSGPVNAVAPGLVRMRELAGALGHQLRRPALFRVPLPALRLVLGEMGAWVNPGQKVIPRAALAAGYHFGHEKLETALAAALG